MSNLFTSRRHILRWLSWFTLANAIVLVLMAQQYTTLGYWPENWMPRIYWVLQSVGHFVFLSFVAFIPIAIIAIIIPYLRLIKTLAVLFFTSFIIVIQVDIQVFALYRFHLNAVIWKFLTTKGAAMETFVMDPVNFIIAAAGILFVLVVEIILAVYLYKFINGRSHLYGKSVATLLLGVLLSGQLWHVWADARQDVSILKVVTLIPWPSGITAKRFFRKNGWLKVVDKSLNDSGGSNTTFFYPKNPMQCQANDKPPLNVLFVVVDSWRFDMFTPEVTPNAYDFSKDALVFEHNISSGNSTRFGMFGLFSGLISNYWHAALSSQAGSVFVKELKRRGYDFGLFRNARMTSPEFDRTIFADVKDYIAESTPGKTVDDRDITITKQFVDYAANRDKSKPFMSLVFYDAPHTYAMPKDFEKPFLPSLENINYLALNKNTDPVPFRNRYKNSIYFNDQLMGEVFAALKDNDLLDSTIVVVTGDHGQEFNETNQNYWGHNGNFSRYQVQVPLIIHWPGKQKKTFTHISSHVDVVPTLMQEMLNCSNDVGEYSNGRSLFDESSRDFVISSSWSKYSVIQPEQTTVYHKLGITEIFDENYQLVDEPVAKKDVTLSVLNELSRFRKQ